MARIDKHKSKLWQRRKAAKLRQEDVGRYLGLSNSQYGRYESGESSMRYEMAKRLAAFFKCEVGDLGVVIGEDDTDLPQIAMADLQAAPSIEPARARLHPDGGQPGLRRDLRVRTRWHPGCGNRETGPV